MSLCQSFVRASWFSQGCKNGPVQVLAMTNLVAAYQQNDIMAFERILRTNK